MKHTEVLVTLPNMAGTPEELREAADFLMDECDYWSMVAGDTSDDEDAVLSTNHANLYRVIADSFYKAADSKALSLMRKEN